MTRGSARSGRGRTAPCCAWRVQRREVGLEKASWPPAGGQVDDVQISVDVAGERDEHIVRGLYRAGPAFTAVSQAGRRRRPKRGKHQRRSRPAHRCVAHRGSACLMRSGLAHFIVCKHIPCVCIVRQRNLERRRIFPPDGPTGLRGPFLSRLPTWRRRAPAQGGVVVRSLASTPARHRPPGAFLLLPEGGGVFSQSMRNSDAAKAAPRWGEAVTTARCFRRHDAPEAVHDTATGERPAGAGLVEDAPHLASAMPG